MDSEVAIEIIGETIIVTTSVDPAPPLVIMDSNDVSTTINEDQMETQDVFLPLTITQKSQDDEKADSGSPLKESLWVENNVEISAIVKEDVEDDCCISQSQINEDNWNLTIKDELEMEEKTEYSSAENSIDVNETAQTPAEIIRRKTTTEWQLSIVKFMKEYYQKHPKARLTEIASAMDEELELPWRGPTLLKYVGLMIYKCRDALKAIDLGNCNMEDDKELIYKQCPYFHEMREALQFSEFYRKGGRSGKNSKNYFQVESSRSKKLKLKSKDEDEMETAETPEDDAEIESGTVFRSCDTSTDDNLDGTKTGKESDISGCPMDEGNCKHSGNDELEPNTAEENEIDSEPSDEESSSDVPERVKKPTRNRMDKQSIEFQNIIIRFMKNYYKKNPSAKQVEIQRAMIKQLKINWAENKLSNYIAHMIRLYRDVREIIDEQKLSFEDLDEDYRKPCPFYEELHEALQLSDYYRNRTFRPGRPKKIQPVKRSSSTSSEDEADGTVARTRIWNKTQKNCNAKSTEDKDQLNSEKSTEKKCIPSKKMLEKREKSMSTMKTQNNKRRRYTPDTCRSIAIFMKEYFKKNPSSLKIQMVKDFKKETKSPLAVWTIIKYVQRMLRSYRLLRCEFDKLKSCANRKKLISERCPFYDDIHEAYEYSDFYRTSNWKPDARSRNTLKTSASSTSKFRKDNKNEECVRVKIEPIESSKQKAVKSKLKKTRTQETPKNSGKEEVAKTTKKPETSTTVHKIDKRMRNPLDWTPELQIKFAKYMRNYYKKDPKVTQITLQKMIYKHFKLKCNVGGFNVGIANMIKTYRVLRHKLGNPDTYSSSLKKELRSKRCPYFFEMHEAYQYSDFYRNSNWTPDSPSRNTPPSKPGKDIKNEKSQRVKIGPVKSSKQRAVKSKLMKTRTQETPRNSGTEEEAKTAKKPETPTTNTVHKINRFKKDPLDWTPELQIKFATYMRDYYKKDPKVMQTTLRKLTYKHFNLNCNVGGFNIGIENMIRTYRVLRHRLGNPDTYSSSLIKELRSKRCPYFFEMHEAYQYSDFYRNCNWNPKSKGGRPPRKTSELQPTTSNASSDDEMETTDETTDCPTSPKTAKRSISEGKNSTSRDRHLEHSVIGREAVIRIPPMKLLDSRQKQAISEEAVIETPPVKVLHSDQKQHDSEEAVVETLPVKVRDDQNLAGCEEAAVVTAPLHLHECDHKQDSSNEPVEQANANVKNQVAINESKLSSEHQLELIKLEDRKEERQFQMQLTKLQQEHEIRKLKLQIKHERVKNLKQ